ncbi:MAG TPA: glucoamylase family protein [Verrucomicrobiae bacterium]|nr:glucoamylase family protein [Verrucomicrobiae bacterium]
MLPSLQTITRREALARLGAFFLLTTPGRDALLEDLVKAGFLFFWEASNADTGLVKDRALADGQTDSRQIGSIAATGFGLTALCISAERGYLEKAKVEERVVRTLEYLWEHLPQHEGFFYHFVNVATGAREWKCELSSIDTGLLMCGVLMCGEYWQNARIRKLAEQLYRRVDWRWMLNDGECLSHGWKPESGFLKNRWDHYCEHMLLYLLAMGSPTRAVPAASWHAWRRPVLEYEGMRFIAVNAPLFVHQYSHAWVDFAGKRDRYTDYFQNSVLATKAHRLFCLKLQPRFPQFTEDLWGITASDSARGYRAWGGPPEHGKLDGTIVPCAAAGSIPFLPKESLHTLRKMRERFGDKVWKRYGFIDAFNPHTNWFNPDVIGIDVGITMLMAENYRSGFVWKTFMRNRDMRRAMQRAGFAPA